MSISILGVILAGGQASRMNYVAKGLAQYQGQALVSYPFHALSKLCHTHMMNANQDQEAYEKWGIEVFADGPDCIDKGPLSGVYAALMKAQTLGMSHILISPCDTPLVGQGVFALLKSHAEAQPNRIFYIESESGIQPLHAILPVAGMAEKLAAFLKDQARVMRFYHTLDAQGVYWSEEKDFLNINYLDQLT